MRRRVLIKGGHWGRLDVAAGQRLEVLNVDGEQICDFFAFLRGDVREFLSPAHTRGELMKVSLGVGDRLYSVARRPMFEILEDDVGRHDMIFPACDPARYRIGFGVESHRSCRTNLAEAMADHDIAFAHLPDPVNLFQNTPVLGDGTISYSAASLARPGDRMIFRALVDAIVIGSACAMDLSGINGAALTDIRMSILDDAGTSHG